MRSSDFALSEFRFLGKLVMQHGRMGYRNVSYFICFYFYKNIVLVLTEIYFAFVNNFSGQIFFADWLPLLYNSLWSSWPAIFVFAFDRVSLCSNIFYRTWSISVLASSPRCTSQDTRTTTSTYECSGNGSSFPFCMAQSHLHSA